MTLEGERVLSYCLSWPEEENCRRITRYYARAARLWQDRWEKHLYPLACLELVRCREQAGVFIPWRCEMTGKLAFCGRGLVSVVLTVREMDRPGRSRTVVKGITWRLKDGRPLPMGELLAPEQRRKKRLTAALRPSLPLAKPMNIMSLTKNSTVPTIKISSIGLHMNILCTTKNTSATDSRK